MNSIKKLIISLMTMAFATACGFALPMMSPERYKFIVDSVNVELNSAKTSADSIPFLYDLFDLAGYNERTEIVQQLYQTAHRAGNIPVQIDMCMRLGEIAAQYSDSTLYATALDLLMELPKSEQRDLYECHIKCLAGHLKRFQTEQELSDEIQRLLTELNDPENSANLSSYDRIARMFNLADYLQGFTQGNYLTEFFDQIDKEITRLPAKAAAGLQYKFYSTAALAYLRNEQFDKAVKADKRNLSLIDRMENENKGMNREFREFNLHRYISYRRMLRCYPALSEAEVEALYDTIKEMGEQNIDFANDMEEMPVPEMALHMKKGEYAEAMPYLIHLCQRAGSLYDKKYYLRRAKEAAEKTHNNDLLAQASVAYADILEQYIDMKTAERMHELQISYQVQSIRDSSTEELRKREHLVTILAIIASILLIIVIIVFVIMTTRNNKQKHKLAKINAKLESDAIQLRETSESLSLARDKAAKAMADKSQLVNYLTNEVTNPINAIIEYSQMIVDNSQGENQQYLERFKSVVEMNIKMLQGLMADVQELAAAENDELPINRAPVDLNLIGQLAVESIVGQVHKGVDLKFIPANGGERTVFNTDPRRAEIVLLNLLNNAAKFTTRGSISLEVSIDPEGNAVYRVTDTGIGVPADKAEIIFKRFEKLDPATPGVGLGLSVCELVARALGAKVALDTSYPGPGASFVLIIPPYE